MASITDEVAGVCVPFNPRINQQPLLLWWQPTNTPIYMDTNDTPSGGNSFQVLQSEPNDVLNSMCNALVGGGAKSFVYVTSDLWKNTLGTNVGLVTDVFGSPGTGVLFGGMDFFQTFSGNAGCPVSTYCVGLDSQFGSNFYTATATGGIHVNIVTFDGGSPRTVAVYRDGTLLGSAASSVTIATQANMSLGGPSNGSQIVLDWAFTSNVMTGTQITNVANALASYYSGRSPGYAGPGDLFLPTVARCPSRCGCCPLWAAIGSIADEDRLLGVRRCATGCGRPSVTRASGRV